MPEARDVSQLFNDGAVVDEALRLAALAARRAYARAGLSMPVWCDGRVEWVAPEDLEIDDGAAPRSEPAD